VDPSAVEAALARNRDIRAVHVTTPSSYGFSIPLEEIAASAARHGVPLIVDEAHGTHFALHPRFPRPALACGADIVVHSPHKSLGALTQSALLHQQGDLVDPASVARILQMLQSSSPSSVLLVSLAVALDEMATRGLQAWAAALALADQARARISAIAPLIVCGADVAYTSGITALDPTKLVVDCSGLHTSGHGAARWLKAQRRIHPESSDLRRLVFSLTIGDTEASVDVLVEALSALSAAGISETATERIVSLWPAQTPDRALTPREAAAKPNVAFATTEAVGAICAEMIVPYPPGVPIVVAGEVISSELVASVLQLLDHGCRMVGMSDPTGNTLRCVDAPKRQPPPATAGRIVSSPPDGTAVSSPSRKRMSSPPR
jgi:arginine decarboxylase